jgi:hypothetical protein
MLLPAAVPAAAMLLPATSATAVALVAEGAVAVVVESLLVIASLARIAASASTTSAVSAAARHQRLREGAREIRGIWETSKSTSERTTAPHFTSASRKP